MSNKIKNIIKDNYINILITLVYFLIHLFLLSRHELWRDEAQAYSLVKHSSLIELFKYLRIEGHPFLWFIYIFPFAKSGIPFNYFGYISLLTMTFTVYSFLNKSPFNKWLTVFVLLSSSFFYYNAVICRVYCLPVLILVFICSLYKDKLERPILYLILVSLLLQTHIKMSGMAIGLYIDFFISAFQNDRAYLKYLPIPVLNLLLLIVELIPYKGYRPFVPIAAEMETLFDDIPGKLSRGIDRIFSSSFGFEKSEYGIILSILLLISLIIIIFFVYKEHRFKEYTGLFLIILCGLGAYYLITAFIYGLHRQMASLLMTMIISFTWLYEYKSIEKVRMCSRIVLIVLIGITIPLTMKDAIDDVDGVYSYGEQTARFIIDNLEENSVVLLDYDDLDPLIISLVEPYRKDIVFYDTAHRRPHTVHLLSEYYEFDPELIAYIGEELDTDCRYFLCRREIHNEKYELVYTNFGKPTLGSEEYFNLYRFRFD